MNVVTMNQDEQVLLKIVQILPSNRVAQLIDFARFLEARSLSESLIQEEDLTEIEADNTRWDRLLATEASQNLLTKMAEEALSEHRAGKTQRMIFDEEGKIAPG